MEQLTIAFRWKGTTIGSSFGARPLRALRARLLSLGPECLPRSWRKRNVIQRILATPPWADFTTIRKIYDTAQQLTVATGIEHHVDHIVPLLHPLVCGLHVDYNMQVLTRAQNMAKSNYWNPDQLELF